MNQKTLYLECNSGISGDMTVAALLDLGADRSVLENVLASLPINGFHIEISRVKKSGLDVCDFNVLLDGMHDNHDHDMEYLHGHQDNYTEDTHECEDGHHHTHEHHNTYEHNHTHGHHHEHIHRGLSDIREIIDVARMTEGARTLAYKIFDILADAEAKAHGVSRDEVHFHEVGAVDSIVDIVAVAVCIDNLGITDCVVPVLYEGSGNIRCQHGILPVPVPAVANIVASHGLKLSIMHIQGEFVTPTGAAIVAAIKTSDVMPDRFEIEKIGYGAGKREYERPSLLRAMLISPQEEAAPKDLIWKLESNIDDSTGEELGYCMEQLFKAGARDVHYYPVFMKKNRPAYQLNVICEKKDIPVMEEIIFRETTTIGIRRVEMERTVLNRKVIMVMTDMGKAKVKVCEYNGSIQYYPEYDSVTELCKKTGLSYREVYRRVAKEYERAGFK